MKYCRFCICVLLLFTLFVSTIAQNTQPVTVSGNKVTKNFIKTHIDFPEKDLKNKVQGTVKIKFLTDKLGNVISYNVVQKVSPEIDSSAVSIFKLILWEPALANGKPTTGTSEFEIKYNPKTFLKLTKRRGYKHIVLPHTPVDSSGIIYTPKQTNAPPTPILDPQYSSILDFIYSKLKYPEAASKLGLTGDVEIMFVVETNGLPSNIVAIRTLGGGCTEEAVGIIETMKWYPGIINNEAVRTSYNITITFKKSDGKDGHIPNQQGTGI